MANAWYFLFVVLCLVVYGFKARRMNEEAEDKIKSYKQPQLQQYQPQYKQGTAYKTLEGGERVQQQQQPTYTTSIDAPALDHNGETYVTVKGAVS